MRMKFELIAQARKRYLTERPVRVMSVPSTYADGTPGDDFTFPNIDDIQVVGCKLGMEYLAICHDQEAVEEWISDAMSIAKDPEALGILFANVFRGVNIVIGEIIFNAGLRSKMHQMATEAWRTDFDAKFGGAK